MVILLLETRGDEVAHSNSRTMRSLDQGLHKNIATRCYVVMAVTYPISARCENCDTNSLAEQIQIVTRDVFDSEHLVLDTELKRV